MCSTDATLFLSLFLFLFLLMCILQNKVQMTFFRGSCLGGLDCDFRILEAFIQMRSLSPETEQEDVSGSVEERRGRCLCKRNSNNES